MKAKTTKEITIISNDLKIKIKTINFISIIHVHCYVFTCISKQQIDLMLFPENVYIGQHTFLSFRKMIPNKTSRA